MLFSLPGGRFPVVAGNRFVGIKKAGALGGSAGSRVIYENTTGQNITTFMHSHNLFTVNHHEVKVMKMHQIDYSTALFEVYAPVTISSVQGGEIQ